MNDWMGRGLAPLAVEDTASVYDNWANGGNFKKFSPYVKWLHDLIAHANHLGPRETGLSISAEEFYLQFAMFRDSDHTDPLMSKNLDVFWFYVFHEMIEMNYGPAALKRELAEQFNSGFQDLRSRMIPGDIGDFYEGECPSEASLRTAYDALISFAEEISEKYALQ